MHAMIQGSDGISLAHGATPKLMGGARRLSLVTAMFLIAAFVAWTAGTSYARPTLADSVVVSNFGTLFAGSFETFAAGSVFNSVPEFLVIGCKNATGAKPCTDNTLLGDGNGAAGDAQSSLTGDIAVAVPLGIAGVFPNGFVETYPFGANGNSSATSIIVSPAGAPDLTGISLGQGVAFEDPFDGVHTLGLDILAVANFTPLVVGPDLHIPGLGLCAPNAPGFSLGTISEYDTTFLLPGINDTPPLNNSPVTGLTPPSTIFSHNATIGGCDTFLLGPVGVAFDDSGDLFVVNETGKYVTVYAPGAHGNAIPIAFIGAIGPTAGAFVDPLFVAVSRDGNTMYVTDEGDNSIKIFDVFTNFELFAFTGSQTGTISGRFTKLKRPQGIALDASGEHLYVVNNNNNSLSMFENFSGGGNISPTLTISGRQSKLNFPVGVTLPAFPAP